MAQTEPQLPEIAREVFETFAAVADKRGLKREDWSRLFDFIRHCTSYNVELAERDLVRLLRLNGFDEDQARDVARIFASGQGIFLRKWRGDQALGAGGEGGIKNDECAAYGGDIVTATANFNTRTKPWKTSLPSWPASRQTST